jgi:uncharacterized protein DUF397
VSNTQFPEGQWRKSTYSGDDGGACVELAMVAGSEVVGLRDSKNRQAPHLTIPRAAVRGFVATALATGPFNSTLS